MLIGYECILQFQQDSSKSDVIFSFLCRFCTVTIDFVVWELENVPVRLNTVKTFKNKNAAISFKKELNFKPIFKRMSHKANKAVYCLVNILKKCL